MQILKNEIQLQLTFARQDIESIVPLDKNLDQKISNSELQNADKGLYALFSDGVDLRVDEKPVQIKRIDARATESDAINLMLNFPYQGHEKLSLAMPVIGRFARGHRQHLILQNSKGELLKQVILNAGSDAVFIWHSYSACCTVSDLPAR